MTSAALGAEEPIEHLLKAVELALRDISSGYQKPGQLRDILGDTEPQEQAPGSNPLADMMSSPLAKAVLAGIAAMVVKRVMGRA